MPCVHAFADDDSEIVVAEVVVAVAALAAIVVVVVVIVVATVFASFISFIVAAAEIQNPKRNSVVI